MSKAERALLEGVDPQADAGEAAKALAPYLRRTPEALQAAIIEARERVTERATRYADAHIQSVEGALTAGQFDVAAKHSWAALERLSHENETVLAPKAAVEAPEGVKVFINLPINLGGSKTPVKSVGRLGGVKAPAQLPVEVIDGDFA